MQSSLSANLRFELFETQNCGVLGNKATPIKVVPNKSATMYGACEITHTTQAVPHSRPFN